MILTGPYCGLGFVKPKDLNPNCKPILSWGFLILDYSIVLHCGFTVQSLGCGVPSQTRTVAW